MDKGTEELTKFISIRLTERDYSRLKQIATTVHAQKTVLVRELILSYLSQASKITSDELDSSIAIEVSNFQKHKKGGISTAKKASSRL